MLLRTQSLCATHWPCLNRKRGGHSHLWPPHRWHVAVGTTARFRANGANYW